MRRYLPFFALMVLALSACASLEPSLIETEHQPGTILEVDSLREVSEQQLHERLAGTDIVHVGEQHDNPHSHRVQERIIRRLHTEDPRLSIGLELFREPRQDLLDRWTEGNLREDELREQLSGENETSPLFAYYDDILRFARRENIPLVALKPGQQTVEDFRKSLGERRKKQNTESPQAKFLRKSFEEHVPTGRGFGGFLAVQKFWEHRMARNVHRFLSRTETPDRMVVLTGNFHVAYDFALPDKLARFDNYRQTSVLTLPVEQPLSETFLLDETTERKTERADYVWWVRSKNGKSK